MRSSSIERSAVIPIPQPPTPEPPPKPIPPPSPPPDPMPEPPPTDPIPPPIRARRRDPPVASNSYPPHGLRSTRPRSAPATTKGGRLSVRDDFLSAVGGHVVAPAGATGRRQSGALRSARRHPDEHRDQWSNEVGFGWTNAAVVELLAGPER